jgi:2-oxo-4-hydroxy-4-carboxy-5-ureidoimidazoline decarboxylase
MTLDDLNRLDDESAAREFLCCCASPRWARAMVASRPFATADGLTDAVDRIWMSLDESDWMDAFAGHPRIGERQGAAGAGGTGGAGGAGKAGGAGEAGWAAEEQAGVAAAAADVRERLAAANRDYEARFGYIFIVCATGRTADEMLDILQRRLANDPDTELRVAAEEQRKIAQLRLRKLLALERLPTT